MGDAAQSMAEARVRQGATSMRHPVGPGRPAVLDVYRALRGFDNWFEQVRAVCADPPADHDRTAEWILDNDYQIIRAARLLRDGFPRHFYDKLPALAAAPGQEAGPPRVFAVAQAAFDTLEPQITLADLSDFVGQYQETAQLTNAELWALPFMIRLVCLERLIAALGAMAPQVPPPASPGLTGDIDTPAQILAQVSRAIPNLAMMDSIKWADFIDAVSPIEAELSLDPAGVYPAMTFETRNRYRRVVERLAERCDRSEAEVAQVAVGLSQETCTDGPRKHVGHWLIGEGGPQIEAALQCRVSRGLAAQRLAARYKGTLYAAGLITLVVCAILVVVAYLWLQRASTLEWTLGIALTVLPATLPSVWFGHWLITRLTTPEPLPEMDFSKAIAPDHVTAVVVPIILGSVAEVDAVVEKVEVLRIANPDPALRFVVLSDLTDAQTRTTPHDSAIEAALQAAITALNRKYGAQDEPPFMLLHRRRQYNPAEGCWMAWERKRGKLDAFNRYVLGEDMSSFDVVAGPTDTLGAARYAITLDADTQMPPGEAARLVGLLAHPLNTAEIDPDSGRVVSGHAIVQPRIEILPKLGKGTHFTHLYGGDTAVDIYSRAVSDVYQDLFGTGVFVGKGIYDIAALHRCMAGRIPDNHILSHDLFEGLHGRAALASNLVFYEDLPATYPDYAMRHHRWMRGDWQLVLWLGRRVPQAGGGTAPTSLSVLDRWKMLDNLRRSLMAPALLLFFLVGWMVLPGSALIWTALALAAPGSYLIGEVFGVATGGIRKGAFGSAVHQIRATGGRWFFSIAFLVSDTLISLDAIFRTLWRVYVSGRKRLEWTSAAHASMRSTQGSIRRASWYLMWPSSALAVVIAGYLAVLNPQGFWPALPVLLLWLMAPEISVWSARPRFFRSERLTDPQRRFLAQVARRTWHFFETFVGPEDNWLPPDNYQFGAVTAVAHRTSPTNIGMFLVSALAARDHGFITTTDLLVRGKNTFDTLGGMASYRGHILNWYDTRTLAPLEPHYVSTVDSGNLAVALITLKQGCLELADRPVVDRACFEGLDVTLDLITGAVRSAMRGEPAAFETQARALREVLAQAQASPLHWKEQLDAMEGPLWHQMERAARDAIQTTPELTEEQVADITTWLERFHHGVRAVSREIDVFVPWLAVLSDGQARGLRPARDIAGQIAQVAAGDSAGLPSGAQLRDILEAWHRANPEASAAARDWVAQLRQAVREGQAQEAALHRDLRDLAAQADQMAFGMDFKFLYDPAMRLFAIGYNQSLGRMDESYYDLLATEARLASYFAIAKHDVPIEHWFAFSRPITRLQGKPSILSWNGSMFEYLMPPLFLASYRDTLLGESELTAIDFQRDYGRDRDVPWGISESAFATTDAHGTFQYRAFGVPGLGIRRGLTEDLVIAPYGSALALCGAPQAAVHNLEALARQGALTRYGFIEALDFTPERVASGQPHAPVTTFMAHHQGMVQAAIVNALQDDVMVHRFLRDKSVHAMDLLLQERVPWDVPLERGRADEVWDHATDTHAAPALAPWVPSPDFVVPQAHVLGNGRMSSLITEQGGGRLALQDLMLTRWRPDPTHTAHGVWHYLGDANSGDLWSLGAGPTYRADADTKCVFHPHMAELSRHHDGIVSRLDVTVAPFDDVEIRRVTLMNEGEVERTLDLTSYAEVVLAPPLDDERHPAFSKLFVHSSYSAQDKALIFTRRPREPGAQPPVLVHKLTCGDRNISVRAFETDRRRFLGRNASERAPEGLRTGLTGSSGWTLDPVMALQVRVTLQPLETRELVFLTVAGGSRRAALETARQYPAATITHTFRDALLETGRRVQQLGIASEHLPELQVLASALVTPHQTFRTPAPTDPTAWGGQPDLWRFGISGDDPILFLRLSDVDIAQLLDILVRGHSLWRHLGLRVDLVILREALTGYEEPLREKVLSIINDVGQPGVIGMRGGIHLLSGDQVPPALRRGVEAAAHVVLHDDGRPLREMLDRVLRLDDKPPPFVPGPAAPYMPVPPVERPASLVFDCGYGGFDPDSGDYVIHLAPGQRTPAPWCNILANEGFGCLVSEAGLGASWAVNSGEHRLTPWSNDPVADRPGEVLYLRDEADGAVWTPTPQPIGPGAACTIRHGMGMTRWDTASHGLEQTLTCAVPADAPVKLVRLRLANRSGQHRRISATFYAEWLLGALGSVSRPHVVSRYDPALKAIVGRNLWNAEFGGRAAFLTATMEPHSITGNRSDFLGHGGDVFDPEGLRRWDLGGHFEDGGDACAAYQVHLDIPDGAQTEVVFALGEVEDTAALTEAVARWTDPRDIEHAFAQLTKTWADRLGAVQVKTPDRAFDLMINRWLPYQNRSCRIMARAGFYQAGGAYGFRDQLQDVLALLLGDPARARAHLLLAARFQFEDGDALHWWHPPTGRGVRTRCSDDYLWLAYVTGRYVEATGDTAVLDEPVAFLQAPELRPDEQDRYALFEAGAHGTLYDHCARALDRMMTTGVHGLPLMGAGDWNDGMDRIGDKGRGESVWLAWFQIATVGIFAPLADAAGRQDDAARWRAYAEGLVAALKAHAWDGAWYKRAFDDDGVPWGSARNEECQIDLIAQAWSVISGAGVDDRARTAMESAHARLVDPEARLIRLLTPPFDQTDRNPGYIRAYPPGIRENGGQYTHAAVWLGVANAMLGDGDRAYQMFDIINPVRRVCDAEMADHYLREPYVLAGDVSGVGAQSGQGGWSWYTGAAGWGWQLGVLGILGIGPVPGGVRIRPCLPTTWGAASVVVEGPSGRLDIEIRDPGHLGCGRATISANGRRLSGAVVPYPGQGKSIKVVVTLDA